MDADAVEDVRDEIGRTFDADVEPVPVPVAPLVEDAEGVDVPPEGEVAIEYVGEWTGVCAGRRGDL